VATIDTTRYEVRHMASSHLDDLVLAAYSDDVASTHYVDTKNLVGYGDDYFNGWTIYIYDGTGSGQSRFVTDYDSATGDITTDAWATTPNGTSLAELHRGSNFGYPSIARYNLAIEQAIRDISLQALIPTVDTTSIMLSKFRYKYDVPSGFAFIKQLLLDDGRVGGDRCDSQRFDSHENFQTAASHHRLGQSFRITDGPTDDGMLFAAAWVMLSKVGSPSYNLRIDVETDSVGNLPSGAKIGTPADGDSATVVATTVTTEDEWYRFSFSPPLFVDYDTDFWLTLVNATDGSTTSGSNYIRWAKDTNNSYSNGASALYDTSWLANTAGHDFIFRMEPYRYATKPLLPDQWQIEHQATKQIHLLGGPQSGDLLNVVGQRGSLLPATDDANVDPNGSALSWISAAILAPTIPESNEGNAQVDVNYIVAQAEQAARNIDVPPQPASKQVESQ
tara:strand:+ start:723 stop:2066 length:1344 start_codon:yes stop_codon:yes gene_type:complete